MFNKIGLGGILSFQSAQAETSIKRVNQSFGGLTNTTNSMNRSFGVSSGALIGAGAAMAGLVAVGGKALSVYTDFTKQMSAVRAVGKLTEEEFSQLRNEAIRLGGETQFTATEAAQGMEELRRAGFDTNEVMAAIGGTLALAAADGMELADASRITANVVRGLGYEAGEAGRVADVLALASAKSNTNVMDLGESMKMAIPTMKMLGIEVEEGAAILGKLADAGLRGTLGGTSFANMMNKLTKPSKKAAAFMRKYNVELTDSDGKMRKVSAITADVASGLSQITDVGDRTAMAMELTGLRGVKAVNALMGALKPPNNINKLEEDLKGASGAAKQMADERLNNMSGQITLLQSATEGFIIRLFDLFKGLDGSAIKPLVDAITMMNQAWDETAKIAAANGGEVKDLTALNEKYGSSIVGVVMGIKDGIQIIQSIIKTVTTTISQLSTELEERLGGDGVRTITKVITVIGGLAFAIAPFGIALATIAVFIGAVLVPIMGTIATVAVGVMGPIGGVMASLIGLFMVFRNENESFMETATRAWRAIKSAALDFWYNVLMPLWAGIQIGIDTVWPALQETGLAVFQAIKDIVNEFSAIWTELTGDMQTDWAAVGEAISGTTGAVITGALNIILIYVSMIRNAVHQVHELFLDFASGDVLNGFKRLGNMILNTLLFPFREVAAAIAGLMSAALEIPGAATALGDETYQRAVGFSKTVSDFASSGVQLFDVPDRGPAPDVLGEAGVQMKLDTIKYAEVDQSAFMADSMETAMLQNADLMAQAIQNGMANAKINTDVHSSVCIDGKTVAKNQARHQQDLADRLGAQTPPFTRRVRAEQGTLPAN